MKLKKLILTGLVASAAYKLYQNRDQITKKTLEVKETISEGQQALTSTQNQLKTLKEQAADLENTKANLTYKLRVFQQESQPHLKAIQDTLAKYKKTPKA